MCSLVETWGAERLSVQGIILTWLGVILIVRGQALTFKLYSLVYTVSYFVPSSTVSLSLPQYNIIKTGMHDV